MTDQPTDGDGGSDRVEIARLRGELAEVRSELVRLRHETAVRTARWRRVLRDLLQLVKIYVVVVMGSRLFVQPVLSVGWLVALAVVVLVVTSWAAEFRAARTRREMRARFRRRASAPESA